MTVTGTQKQGVAGEFGVHMSSGPWRVWKERAQRTGAQGVVWRGAKVMCKPKHKDMRGLRIEGSYLTTGGSNVLAVVSRYVNLTSAPWDLHAGIVAFAQPGGSRERLQGVIERYGAIH